MWFRSCSEEGGVAYPQNPLCHPSNFTFDGFGADNLVYYVDAWASPPYDDAWHDISGSNTDHPAVWTELESGATQVVSFDSSSYGGAMVFDGDGYAFKVIINTRTGFR